MNSLLQFTIYTFMFNWSAVSTYIIDNSLQHNINTRFPDRFLLLYKINLSQLIDLER